MKQNIDKNIQSNIMTLLQINLVIQGTEY